MGILISILVLGVLVFVHELGHFLVAKFFGVGVLEFALGFGRPLCRWQGKETTYSIRAIPLGGFVRMAGDDPVAVYGESVVGPRLEVEGASPVEGSQDDLTESQQRMIEDESRWFLKKTYGPRCAIVLAGPLANFIFAWVLAFAAILIIGLPVVSDGPVTIGGVFEGSPADQAGVRKGDKVLSVDGKPIESFKDLMAVVQGSRGNALAFEVERTASDGQRNRQEVVTVQVKPTMEMPSELEIVDGRSSNPTYRVGIQRSLKNVSYEPADVQTALSAANTQVVALSLQNLRGLRALITGRISATKSIGGPIEIIKQTAASADEGVMALIGFMIFLNITLAIMNLLPIPILDGGHLTLFTIELLRGRPLTLRSQARIMNVGMLILGALMVFAIGNDLRRVLL
jgi:regulator of sigma E protease